MAINIPRAEYPRPQFVRGSWANLNGEWEFYNDLSASGADRELWKCEKFDGTITVPFCPESDLSGVGYKDFMTSVWYAKNIDVTAAQLEGRVLIHFGACDYLTSVYVNGNKVGTHKGGYTSFTFDITDSLTVGGNRIVVHALDDVRTMKQPAGKQSRKQYSFGCYYTRTTGIWQTVWLEYVPETYIEKIKITATDLGGEIMVETHLNKYVADASLKIEASFEGKPMASRTITLSGKVSQGTFTVSEVYPWNVGEPNLYDVRYTLIIDGKDVDTADGYFGIRRIDIDGYKVRINGKSVFQRLVLDQGFYPDGIYTAPTDEALVRDIEYSMNAGFNGARLHEKVFEERFLYHADKMGYLVWGEYPNWGVDTKDVELLHTYLPEWLESIERDYNHPSIVGWCPYNETWSKDQLHSNVSMIALATKYADPTRPVIDASGGYHAGITDIYDEHDYNQDPAVWEERCRAHANGEFFNKYLDKQVKYDGKMPYMVSEYGGIKWNPDMGQGNRDMKKSWGYGNAPQSMEEFCERYCKITAAIMATPNIMGFCYTQITDVEQEQNGLYYYDRSLKFPKEIYDRIKATNTAKAAIEEE
ncbi:MAG: beta-galactosidase [Clostridia bacterium]|nr:beta-galactosidase [Clostridia bacterium]